MVVSATLQATASIALNQDTSGAVPVAQAKSSSKTTNQARTSGGLVFLASPQELYNALLTVPSAYRTVGLSTSGNVGLFEIVLSGGPVSNSITIQMRASGGSVDYVCLFFSALGSTTELVAQVLIPIGVNNSVDWEALSTSGSINLRLRLLAVG